MNLQCVCSWNNGFNLNRNVYIILLSPIMQKKKKMCKTHIHFIWENVASPQYTIEM